MDQWRLAHRIALGILRRRKTLAVVTFLLAVLVTFPAAYYLSHEPPRYQAVATILLEVKPDRVPLFQELSPMRPLSVQMAILRSRSLAESVLSSLPRASVQDLTDNLYYVDYLQKLVNLYHRLLGVPPVTSSSRGEAVAELQGGRMKFVPLGDGLVSVSAIASKPEIAVDLAQTYIEVLLGRTRTFNIDDARVSREFLEQQVADVKKKLQASEESLRVFTSSHGGIKVPEQSQATTTQLSQAETALAEVQANRKMIESRLAGLREKVEQQKRTPSPAVSLGPASTPTPSSAASPEVRRLRDQLEQLETTLLDLRMRFTDEHPRVRPVKDKLAELRSQLGSAVKESTIVTPMVGAVPPSERVNFSEQLVALETSLLAMTAQEEALRKQADTLRASLAGLSRSELAYSRLGREVDSNRNLYSLLSEKLTAARIREQGEMKVVKVIDPPELGVSASNDKRFKFLTLAAGLALLVGGGVPVAAELLGKHIESEDDVHQATDLQVIALVPHRRSGRPVFTAIAGLERPRQSENDIIFSEAFRSLRVAVQLAMRSDNVRSLLIASASPGDGKTTVLINLGLAFNEGGTHVVLADTDFLRPTLHSSMHVPSTAGLGEVLRAERTLDDSLFLVADGLWVAAPAHGIDASVRGSLATSRLKALVGEMATKAELVICDSPPVLAAPESLFLGSAVDAVILVVKAGRTSFRDLARTKRKLESVGARILGVVINDLPAATLRRTYRRYAASYQKDNAMVRKIGPSQPPHE